MNEIEKPCGSGKKYKNCCGRNQKKSEISGFFYACKNAEFKLDTNFIYFS